MSPTEESAAPDGPDDGSVSDESPDAEGSQIAPDEAQPTDADAPVGEPAEVASSEPTAAAPTGASAPPRATAAGRVWVGLTVGVVLVVLLIIFIAENSGSVTVSFLGAHGKISLGLAMLGAAVLGAIVTLLVGTTRILQLRREVRRNARHREARRT
jgi:uncharacterized integral membrane protein